MRVVQSGGLSHSGVPGMKWFEHKFGKWQKQAQYAAGQDDPDKISGRRKTLSNILRIQSQKNTSIQKQSDKGSAEKTPAKGPITREELLSSNDPKVLYQNRSMLSTQELAERVNRIRVEEDMRRLIPTPKQSPYLDRGKQVLVNGLTRGGEQVVSMAAAGLGSYGYQQLVKAVADKETANQILRLSKVPEKKDKG